MKRHEDAHFTTLRVCLRALLREFGEADFVRILKEAAELENVRSVFEMCRELESIYREKESTPTPPSGPSDSPSVQ